MAVVRVRKQGFDQYGDPIVGTPTRLTLTGAFTAPRTSSDVDDRGRQGVIDGKTLYAPYPADVLATDEIEEDDVPYIIEGEVGKWKNPWTQWEAGIEVALVRAVG